MKLPSLLYATLALANGLAASNAAAQVGPAPAFVSGTVLDRATGAPLEGAVIEAAGWPGSEASDSLGRFRLKIAGTGTVVVRVRRIGYEPQEVKLEFESGSTISLDISLTRVVVDLPEVAVRGTSSPPGIMAGFDDRRRRGGGVFYDLEALRQMEGRSMTDALRQTRGVRMTSRGVAVSSRNNCPLTIFIDGQRLVGGAISLYDLPPLTAYLGVEVYSGAATLPPQFKQLGADCGALILWSRRGTGET